MDECRILWSRYQLAMERRETAKTVAEQAAWWAEANEWLGRYFDAVDRQLERNVEKSTNGQPAVLNPVPPRLILPSSQRGGARPL